MRKNYYVSANLQLDYEEDNQIAYAVWNGFLSSQRFQEASLKCAELMESKNIKGWLADNRKMKAIRQADQQWFLDKVMPRILQSPLERMATLVSEDLFNKMAVDQLLQRVAPGGRLVLQDFKDETEALVWLRNPHIAQASTETEE